MKEKGGKISEQNNPAKSVLSLTRILTTACQDLFVSCNNGKKERKVERKNGQSEVNWCPCGSRERRHQSVSWRKGKRPTCPSFITGGGAEVRPSLLLCRRREAKPFHPYLLREGRLRLQTLSLTLIQGKAHRISTSLPSFITSEKASPTPILFPLKRGKGPTLSLIL